MTNKVFIGFFLVDGQPDSVEVPLTGNGNVDRAALAKAIRDRHPKASTIVPNGTRFGTRSEDAGFIETSEGMVLRNIFPHDDKNPAFHDSGMDGLVLGHCLVEKDRIG